MQTVAQTPGPEVEADAVFRRLLGDAFGCFSWLSEAEVAYRASTVRELLNDPALGSRAIGR